MEQNLENVFAYAIENGNIQMFDLLAKDFDKFDEKDKNFLLEKTVICSPSIEFLQHVLDYGFDVNSKKEDGFTLLHFAASSSYPATVKFFLDKGIDVNVKDNDNTIPICIAAEYSDNPEVLQTLIDAGADIHVTQRDGETLLISAAGRNPNPEITKFLLNLGFDIEDRDEDGFTALLNAAAWQRNPDVIDVLLEAGANKRAKSKYGDSMLHLVSHNRSKEVARYISDAFFTSDVNNSGESCLEKMLKYGTSPSVLKVLLEKMKEEQIFFACTNEEPEILETLIKSGYNVNTMDSSKMTPIMFVAKVNSNPVVIKMLSYYGAIWDTHDIDGRNIIHYAAANSDPTIYNWLLENEDYEGLIKEKDYRGKLPAYYREHPDKF